MSKLKEANAVFESARKEADAYPPGEKRDLAHAVLDAAFDGMIAKVLTELAEVDLSAMDRAHRYAHFIGISDLTGELAVDFVNEEAIAQPTLATVNPAAVIPNRPVVPDQGLVSASEVYGVSEWLLLAHVGLDKAMSEGRTEPAVAENLRSGLLRASRYMQGLSSVLHGPSIIRAA